MPQVFASMNDECSGLLGEAEGGGHHASLRELRRAEPSEGSGEAEELRPGRGIFTRSLVAGLCGGALLAFVVASKKDSISWLRGRSSRGSSLVSVFSEPSTTMRWLAHPTKCLDVAGESSGAGLQIWDCDPNYPYQQEFLVPPEGTTGRIKWANDPNLCLDAPGGVALQFWSCEGAEAEHMLWTISPDGKGRLHLAADPTYCVDVPDEQINNGWKLQVWPCHNYSFGNKDQDMRFITHPVDCQWGEWQQWGPCSVSCGEGRRVRSRSVAVAAMNGGEDCGLRSEDSETCRLGACLAAEAHASTSLVPGAGAGSTEAGAPGQPPAPKRTQRSAADRPRRGAWLALPCAALLAAAAGRA